MRHAIAIPPVVAQGAESAADKPSIPADGKGHRQQRQPEAILLSGHMDVVAANPKSWDRNPFQLTREGYAPRRGRVRGRYGALNPFARSACCAAGDSNSSAN